MTDQDDRGALRIDPAVVRKIAEHAADAAPGTTSVKRKLIGSHGASATVTGAGDTVSLRLDLALHYPAKVREVVSDVRAKVAEEVERITSYRVLGVDVTVSALLPATRPRVE
ncbi:Asp23/Gls24 family envelope stress response protein [Actinokineospora sp. G85]|uniref:Asp23/Gls24 family envelope stress response protein n=1 Tax=Actinokineospora sp. G85 TaxID=3406626 RepID=UPI003C7811A6